MVRFAERVVLALVGDVVARPERGHRLQHLVHPPPALLVRHAHERELLLVPADAHAQDAAPAREQVERGPLLGEVGRVAERQDQHHGAEPDGAGDAGQGREQRHRLEPGAGVGGRGQQQMVDGHRAVEAQVLGAPQVGAHLGERRGRAGRARSWEAQAELHASGAVRPGVRPLACGAHRSPSSFLASATVRPPTRAWGRPPSGDDQGHQDLAGARRVVQTRTSIASKWVRTKAASL